MKKKDPYTSVSQKDDISDSDEYYNRTTEYPSTTMPFSSSSRYSVHRTRKSRALHYPRRLAVDFTKLNENTLRNIATFYNLKLRDNMSSIELATTIGIYFYESLDEISEEEILINFFRRLHAGKGVPLGPLGDGTGPNTAVTRSTRGRSNAYHSKETEMTSYHTSRRRTTATTPTTSSSTKQHVVANATTNGGEERKRRTQSKRTTTSTTSVQRKRPRTTTPATTAATAAAVDEMTEIRGKDAISPHRNGSKKSPKNTAATSTQVPVTSAPNESKNGSAMMATNSSTHMKELTKERIKESRKKNEEDKTMKANSSDHNNNSILENLQGEENKEELYCICHRPSYGDMIACDNPDCPQPSEWYHVSCVGLTVVPETWSCPLCSSKKKNEKEMKKE